MSVIATKYMESFHFALKMSAAVTLRPEVVSLLFIQSNFQAEMSFPAAIRS